MPAPTITSERGAGTAQSGTAPPSALQQLLAAAQRRGAHDGAAPPWRSQRGAGTASNAAANELDLRQWTRRRDVQLRAQRLQALTKALGVAEMALPGVSWRELASERPQVRHDEAWLADARSAFEAAERRRQRDPFADVLQVRLAVAANMCT